MILLPPVARSLFPILLALAVSFTGCESGRKTDNPFTGKDLNQVFPQDEGGFVTVFTQEKEGISQALLKQNGAEVATLAVSDTIENPAARDKFAAATETLDGHPLASSGSKGTAVLVAGRFQVQVRSRSGEFGPDERKAWLRRFDLDTLAELAAP